MEITMQQFISYITTSYNWVVPLLIFLAFAIICILDWARVWGMDWLDDYETKFQLKLLTSFGGIERYICQASAVGRSTFYVKDLTAGNKVEGVPYATCRDGILDWIVKNQEEYVDVVENFFCILIILCALSVVLTLLRFIPLTTITVVGVVGTLLMARGATRLGKKFKKHIADPQAHTDKGDTE